MTKAERDKLLAEIEELRMQVADEQGKVIALEHERDGLRKYIQQQNGTIEALEQQDAGLLISLSAKDLGKVRRLAPHMLMSRHAHAALAVKYPPRLPISARPRGRPATVDPVLVTTVQAMINTGQAKTPKEAIRQIVTTQNPGSRSTVIDIKAKNLLRKYQRHNQQMR